jgi:hypothetical protein
MGIQMIAQNCKFFVWFLKVTKIRVGYLTLLGVLARTKLHPTNEVLQVICLQFLVFVTFTWFYLGVVYIMDHEVIQGPVKYVISY